MIDDDEVSIVINHFQPNTFNMFQVQNNPPEKNLTMAFEEAKKLGIPKLLEEKDLLVSKPDKEAIITYLTSYYKFFVKKKAHR